jgi:hypothetical protein
MSPLSLSWARSLLQKGTNEHFITKTAYDKKGKGSTKKGNSFGVSTKAQKTVGN